jgi:cell wall-associated NlpC family hydrolase
MPKHRAPRYVRTKQVIAKAPVAAGATALGLGVLSTSPANAATTHDWSGVANCESSGNWSVNTGNGYYGGLQFSQSTWAGYGGTTFAARADLASPAQQVQIAEKVLAGQGVGAWPVCGKYLTGGSTSAADQRATAPAASAPAASAPAAPAPATTTPFHGDGNGQDDAAGYGRHAATAGDYTVVSGDTVAKIASAHGEAWRDLYERNAGIIGSNPNLIFPGQVLTLTGTAQSTPVATTATAHTITAPTTASRAATGGSSAGAVAEKVALEQLGRPYVYGGESPSGFDCSGLVQYAYQAAGVSLPRTSGEQMSAGTEVSEADLQAGDLVFFYGGTHVGIYVGNGEVVHAPVPGDVVKITEIAYMPYTTARRIG